MDFISYYSVKKSLRILFKKYNPSLLHLFGSEFIHSYIAAKIFNKPEKTILHIQGIVSELYKVYDSDFSFFNRFSFSLSDFIRGNIIIQKYKYKLKSFFEKKLLRNINLVTGRTKWDKDISLKINNKLTYFHLNENLRDLFYQNKYKPKNNYYRSDKIIFYLSQAAYPVKGLHLFLPIMSYLKNSGLNVELNITGKNFSKTSFFLILQFFCSILIGNLKYCTNFNVMMVY
jgi:glycosyltransferase involved in cell wall biosynthesis